MDTQKAQEINKEKGRATLQLLKHYYAMLEDLPEALVSARRSAKITQLELGEELGCDRKQVGRDESERYHASALHKLKRVLHATIKLVESRLEN